jgi:hypothetical protein
MPADFRDGAFPLSHLPMLTSTSTVIFPLTAGLLEEFTTVGSKLDFRRQLKAGYSLSQSFGQAAVV